MCPFVSLNVCVGGFSCIGCIGVGKLSSKGVGGSDGTNSRGAVSVGKVVFPVPGCDVVVFACVIAS